MPDYKCLLYEVKDAIATLTLNRPERLNALGDTLRDQEHDKFAQEFAETVQALTRFMEVSQQHIPFLLRKAERIEEYIQQR